MKKILKSKKLAIGAVTSVFLAVALFLAISFLEGKNEKKIQNDAQAQADGCPTPSAHTWVGVSDFCMLEDEVGSDDWVDAAEECEVSFDNSRLCSAAEWVATCRMSEPGGSKETLFRNMTGDYEWTSEVNNTNGAGRVVVAGNTDCDTLSDEPISTSQTFRCCVNKMY